MPNNTSTQLNIVVWGFNPRTGKVAFGVTQEEPQRLFIQGSLTGSQGHAMAVGNKFVLDEDDYQSLVFDVSPLGPHSETGWLTRPAYARVQVDMTCWRSWEEDTSLPQLTFHERDKLIKCVTDVERSVIQRELAADVMIAFTHWPFD